MCSELDVAGVMCTETPKPPISMTAESILMDATRPRSVAIIEPPLPHGQVIAKYDKFQEPKHRQNLPEPGLKQVLAT
jgi:hypothetical protein